MEAIEKVGAEIEKVLSKFNAINQHSSTLLKNEVLSLQLMRESLDERKLI